MIVADDQLATDDPPNGSSPNFRGHRFDSSMFSREMTLQSVKSRDTRLWPWKPSSRQSDQDRQRDTPFHHHPSHNLDCIGKLKKGERMGEEKQASIDFDLGQRAGRSSHLLPSPRLKQRGCNRSPMSRNGACGRPVAHERWWRQAHYFCFSLLPICAGRSRMLHQGHQCIPNSRHLSAQITDWVG